MPTGPGHRFNPRNTANTACRFFLQIDNRDIVPNGCFSEKMYMSIYVKERRFFHWHTHFHLHLFTWRWKCILKYLMYIHVYTVNICYIDLITPKIQDVLAKSFSTKNKTNGLRMFENPGILLVAYNVIQRALLPREEFS